MMYNVPFIGSIVDEFVVALFVCREPNTVPMVAGELGLVYVPLLVNSVPFL